MAVERPSRSRADVAADVEYLATRCIPLFEWTAGPGWDDEERRFALRHHAGILRVLQGLLRRGLTAGLLDVPSSRIRTWADELPNRRRECCDAVLALRFQGRLMWRSDPPLWDPLFHAWTNVLVRSDRPWVAPVPSTVLQLLVANITEGAAVAAETTWFASRWDGVSAQSFHLRSFGPSGSLEVHALPPGSRDTIDGWAEPSSAEISFALG